MDFGGFQWGLVDIVAVLVLLAALGAARPSGQAPLAKDAADLRAHLAIAALDRYLAEVDRASLVPSAPGG